MERLSFRIRFWIGLLGSCALSAAILYAPVRAALALNSRLPLFEAAEPVGCSVADGRLVAPNKRPVEGPLPLIFDQCHQRVRQTMYQGNHQIPCFVTPSGELASHPRIILVILITAALGLTPLIVFIGMTFMFRRKGGSSSGVAPKRLAFLFVLFTTLWFSLPHFVSDALLWKTRNWQPIPCQIIERCSEDPSAGKTTESIVFEYLVDKQPYRSNSVDGIGWQELKSHMLPDAQPGAQVTCFLNPEHPPQARLLPLSFSLSPYAKILFVASLIGILLFLGLRRLCRRGS